MTTTRVHRSLLRANSWYWCVVDDQDRMIDSGWTADEWLAKAHARVATKRHQEEQDTSS